MRSAWAVKSYEETRRRRVELPRRAERRCVMETKYKLAVIACVTLSAAISIGAIVLVIGLIGGA